MEVVQIRDWLRGYLWARAGRGTTIDGYGNLRKQSIPCFCEILFCAKCAYRAHLRRPVRNSPFFCLRSPQFCAMFDEKCTNRKEGVTCCLLEFERS